MHRLHQICHPERTPPRAPRHSPARQRPRRELEQSIRQGAVEFRQLVRCQGVTRAEAAVFLGLAPRTLRHWEAQAPDTVPFLGRPLVRSSRRERNLVIELLTSLGPSTGLPALQSCCPGMPRSELEDLLRRFRRVYQKRRQRRLHVLHWSCPGTVWAMDFAQAPFTIDGQYPYLLAVRDLASGCQLLWLPVEAETAKVTIDALTCLFTIHGPPLVLKSDNGSAFIAHDTARLLDHWQVCALFSPPRLPSYNGACEAGIGSMKTRTQHQAAHHGHPEHWSSDNVEAARQEANELARPRGPSGPSPAHAWHQRRPIQQNERSEFRALVHQHTEDVRLREGLLPMADLDHPDRAAIVRQAIRRSLVASGLLSFSGGPFL
jgi:Integrase core domain